MSVWFRAKGLTEIWNAPEHAYELVYAPTGTMWARRRGDQEAAELRLMNREHHPDQDRMDRALEICPPDSASGGAE